MFELKPIEPAIRPEVVAKIEQEWGSPVLVSRGRVHRADRLDGFVCRRENELVGLVTYDIRLGHCEIVSLDSWLERQGVGGALVEAVVREARRQGCRRVWLITTNDNTAAMRFYQKRGFRMCALHTGAVAAARKLKPQIPLVGYDGIPIDHEIEFEIVL
ncbi:GNAT family N-acetyltransferase [Paenibacillus sp. GYB003]|uniref:GNAT family N-acetyltransferase n=1 Tax=Paenibacillus sp. GYB003 TaxID=2994392 RepID=UPI002F96A294